MKALGKDFSSPRSKLAAVDGGLGGSVGPAATQAAFAAALEECVIRLTETEAWVRELDAEVRQLRTSVDQSNKAISVLGSQVGTIHERSSDTCSPTRIGLISPQASSISGMGSTMAQCVARLDGDIRHLRLKVDASDEEIEQLKANRSGLATRSEVLEISHKLECILLQEKSNRSPSESAEALQEIDRLRTGVGDLLLRCADCATKQDLHEITEPTRRELRRLSAQVEREKDLFKDIGEGGTSPDYVAHSFRNALSRAVAEFSDSTQIIKQELVTLTDRVACGEERLSKVAQGTSRYELLEATKLLSEVRDASKMLKRDVSSSSEPVLTRREFSNSAELWRREMASMAVQVSQNLAQEPALEIEAAVEGQNNVTRQELREVAHILRQEIENLAGRIQRAEVGWSKEKEEVLLLLGGAAPQDRPLQRQELIDAIEMVKGELQLVSDRDVAAKSDFLQAIETVQQDLTQQIEPLVGRVFENLWRDRFGITLRQELVREFEHEHTIARRDRERVDERIHELEDRMQLRSSNDLSRLSDSIRRDLSDINQRVGRLEFGHVNEGESATTRGRLASLGDRLTMVEVTVGIVSATGPDSTGLAKKLTDIGDSLGDSSNKGMPAFADESTRSGIDVGSSLKLTKPFFFPEGDRDLAHALVDVRRDHHQWYNIIESLVSRFNGFNDRMSYIEATCQGLADTAIRSRSAERDAASASKHNQVPFLPLGVVKSSLGPESSVALGKIVEDVEDLRKRVDELREYRQQSSGSTPRSAGVGSEGMAQLMAAVKKDQESESVLVATLLERIGSLVDRTVSVERKVMTAVENAPLSTSQADQTGIAENIDSLVFNAVQARCNAFTTRLDNLESVIPGLKEYSRRPRCISVVDFLGRDFDFKSAGAG